MTDRVRKELELVKREFGDLEVDPTLRWFVIKGWKLPPGWNRQETNLLVQVPLGYPTTPPDNFYVEEDVRLSSGALPGNTGYGHELGGRRWLFFRITSKAATGGRMLSPRVATICSRFCVAPRPGSGS